MQVGLFSVVLEGSTVSVSAFVRDVQEFDKRLAEAQNLIACFKRSQPGSDWGCDGVGYLVQKNLRHVKVYRSGVGPVNFRRGLEQYRREVLSGRAA